MILHLLYLSPSLSLQYVISLYCRKLVDFLIQKAQVSHGCYLNKIDLVVIFLMLSMICPVRLLQVILSLWF